MCILQCLGYCPKSYVRVLTQSDTLTIAREKAAKALKEKGETPEELLQSIKENEAAVAEVQRVVDAWKAIVGEESRREEAAKAERIATEKAEAERKAAEERERAEAEEKTRIEAEKKEAERIAAEKAEEEARVEAERKAEEERKTEEEERKERDENGQPFVVSSDGTTTFGEITEDTGLTAAPIKLSEGVADEMGNGYGLRHIEARHGDQIRKAGFSSVEEFVKYVASNYDKHNIKIGKKRANGVETYLIQAEDEHSNVLYVELSKDGSYWNVNSGGIFRKGYAEKKKDVGQNTEHPTSATTLQDKSFVQTDKDNGSQSADTHSDKQHPSADKGTTLPADQQTSDKENTKKVADSEGENTLKAKIEAASADVNTEPTEAQKKAGNYKKGHVQVGTFDITIEQPEGSIRRGTDADGKKWESKMHNTYGYFRGTEGVDGDHIDVFLSNDIDGWNGRKVFVVDQYNPDGTFDEHKVMLGFNDMDEAKSDYLANYEKGWENGRRITVSTTNLEDFEKWIDSSHRKTKPFSEYSSVNKGSEKAEKKQKKQSVFDKAKEIADKEEKKRKAEADKPKQKPLTEAERKDAEEVAGALGYRVEWVDTMEENGTIDADKKVIRIAKDAENPLVQVLGHEVAHGVKRMDGGKFKALQKAAMEVVGEKEWNERIEKKRKLNAYAEGKLTEEVTCDIVGEALNNNDALKRLAESLRGEKGILARLRDAVAKMVEYFKNRGDKEGVRRMKAADKLLAEFESALKEGVAPEQVKPEDVDRSVRENRSEKAELTAAERELRDNLVERMRKGGLDVVTDSEEMQRVIDTENERTRNMFVGEKGATEADKAEEVSTRLDNLSVARRMEEAEKDAKAIKMATGWERGSDGKWRYETSDIKPKPFEEWMDKKNLKLGDIIDSDSGLFEMYPELKDFKVTRGKGKSTNAAIYTGLGKIEINFSKFKPYMSIPSNREKIDGILHRVINHEIQHAIQDSEGFAQGVSPNAFNPDAPIGKLREMEEADGRMVERYNAMSYTEKALGEGVRLKERILENRKEYNALASKYRFGMDGYTRAAGEVEARNTEKRIGMTEEERRASLASETEDVAREDQILLGVDNADGEVNTGSVREHRVYHGSGADFDAFDHSHMGEGEGAQAYGWGTYVTEVEGIGRTYAIQNTTKHNDALRALQHDVDAISDQLNRQRDDLKYDEEQLKRANEWRAEAELDYELFKDEAEELKEKYGESSPKYRNHLFNDIYTDEMKRAQSSVKSTEESIQYRKEKIAELEKALKDKQAEIDELPKEFPRHLYTVEIPDDNGSNYLDWNSSLSKEQKDTITKALKRLKVDLTYYESRGFSLDDTFADIYYFLTIALRHTRKWEDVNAIRASSKFLYSLGFTGIKYPADNMRGGREDGAKNYVIFNENDAKITDHTRFLRTAGGEVYGLVKDGRIYLDPKVATSETAVHEYTHLWGDMLRRKDSEQWSHTVKELKNSVLWEEVKELYPELKTDDEIADEVLSTFSGRRGAERLHEEARRVADGEGGVFTKAKAMAALENVQNAIARFWEGVARMFGINRYRSAEELADMAMRDLINGVKPTSRTFTFDNFYKDTKAVFEGTERPKGKPDYISYSGSEYWYGEDKGGKYVVRGSDHWSGEFKVKDGERTNVGRNHYSEITEDGMLPIGAQGSLKFGWKKGLSKPVGSGISAAIDRRGSGDSNNIASCYWYIDNAKEKDNKGFTYGKAYLSEFEDKERRRDIPGDDWRDIQGVEGNARAMAVKKANDRFNEELEMQVKGELEEGHVYKLGMPSEILLSTGVPNLPIQMSAQRLEDKATKFGHNFDIAEVKDLVNAIQKPIAIFEYGDRNKSQNLIVEIQKDGKNFIIGLSLNPVVKGKALEINSVRNVFPKDNAEWLNWISQNKLLYADKEKIQALIDKQQTNLADVNYLNLDDVAKKVKDFENPKLFDGKISEVDKKGSDSIDRSVRENPKSEEPRFSRKPGESIFDYASRVSEDVDRSVRERVSARDEYEKEVKSKGFQTKEALQNSMLGLQEFMSAIDHASGNKRYIEDIPDFENPILGENRLSSVNKEEMHQVAKTQFKPLMSAVAKLSGNGKESGELYDYMFAKHGLERDAVMRQREAQKEFDKYQKANPKGTKTIGDFVASLEGKDYAGLTALTAEDGRVKSIQSQIDTIDEQMKATDDQLLLRKLGGQKKRLKVDLLNAARDAADDIRKAFESNPSYDRSDINELWSRVNEVNGNTLRKLYESGMLTKEAYNDISSMYTNYIPMRGFDQTTSADAYAYLTHGDSAFNAPIKTAKGRSSKADNPIAYMQAMAESAIMQGNRNVLVKQKMLNFVRNHPSDLASVSDVWLQYDSVADEWKPFYAFGRESKGVKRQERGDIFVEYQRCKMHGTYSFWGNQPNSSDLIPRAIIIGKATI